jgi:hypothetical protein
MQDCTYDTVLPHCSRRVECLIEEDSNQFNDGTTQHHEQKCNYMSAPATGDDILIQYFEIGDFLTSAFFVKLVGLPRLAASRFSYVAIAFRCWGVFACA